MMKLVTICLLFTYVSAWADCPMSNGRHIVSIPENKEVSLFESGKSLSGHKTQDQDGLGTCYANTTSAVLKSVLPGNPDVSYVHAALQSSTNGWSQNWSDGKNKYINSEQKDFTYGGFFCETVAALKKTGGACPVNNSILENRQLVNSSVQIQLMKSLGTYFDSINKVKNDPSKLQKMKQDLALVIDSVNLERSKIIQACEAEKTKEIPLKNALDQAITAEIININFSNDCGKFKAERFTEILGSGSNITEDNMKFKIPPSLEMELDIYLKRDPEFMSKLSGHLKQDIDLAASDKAFQENLGRKISEFINSKLNSSSSSNSSSRCQLGSPERNMQTSPEEVGESFFRGIISQKTGSCDDYLQNTAIMEAVKESQANQCISETQLNQMLDVISPLMELGEAIDQSLINKLSNPLSQYGKQLKDMLIPGCSDKSKLIDMKNVSCSSFSMCDESAYLDMSNNTYSGPQGGCYDLGSAKSIVRTRVLNNISSNRALGISMCTAFMNNPNARTGFCKKPVPGVQGHSLHEMTISGYRCKNGKIEYQLLNSWGRISGCPVQNGEKNSAVECSLDENGVRDGKFWVKEDVMVDSTTEISQLGVRANQ